MAGQFRRGSNGHDGLRYPPSSPLELNADTMPGGYAPNRFSVRVRANAWVQLQTASFT